MKADDPDGVEGGGLHAWGVQRPDKLKDWKEETRKRILVMLRAQPHAIYRLTPSIP